MNFFVLIVDLEMDIHESRIRKLLTRYAQGQLTREEFDELFDWLHQEGEQLPGFESIWEEARARRHPLSNSAELFDRIKSDPRYGNPRPPRRLRVRWQYVAAAATALWCCGLAAWLYLNRVDPAQSMQPPVSANVPALEPGGHKATLEWAEGGSVELEDVPTGIAMLSDGAAYGDGAALESGVNRQIQRSETLVLRVPRGGQYRITLEDGTQAWLNAGSALHYPVRFTEGSRQVVLEGEGYFEVAKDPTKPFLVKCGNTVVEVLGTRFNVSAYADDKQMTTTLVEGSVRITRGEDQVVLQPKEAATVAFDTGTPIRIKQVNTEMATAWTIGLFMFDRDAIPDVMKRISRWYDADIVLRGNLSNRTLGGTVSRYESVEKLLDVLALTGNFSYKIEGRRVVVME